MDKRALDFTGLQFAILSTSLSYDNTHTITYFLSIVNRFQIIHGIP